MGYTAFLWPPSSAGSIRRPCACTERRGLLTPARTDGGTRRYSDDDLDRLQRIADLVADGVNIAGIAQILPLQDRNAELSSANGELTSENARLRSQKPRSGRR